MTPYRFTRAGRSWASVGAVVVTWGVVLVAWAVFDAAPWLVTVVLCFTLPALWDIWARTEAGVEIDDQVLRWHSGRRRVEVPRAQIEKLRLDTRLDFSLRATAVLRSGRKMRLPQEAVPPVEAFVAALEAAGIAHERHHFNLR